MVNGGFAYGHLFISQHKDVEKVFSLYLNELRPSRILEIGTFHGGLTLMLRDIMDNIGLSNNPIVTYDVNNQEFLRPLVFDRNVIIYTKNLFNDSYSDFVNDNSRNEIESFISQDGVTLVLCDGGCKKCEFNILSPLLKHNDIIMAHDYAPNIDYFNNHIKDKIWDWLEIQDSDIIESINQYNLQPYDQELMQQVAWCSRRRHG